MSHADKIQIELDAVRAEVAGSLPLNSDFSGVGVSSFSYFSDVQFIRSGNNPLVVVPPCSFLHLDGSISHFVWESTLVPERDTSERLIEIFETPSGHVVHTESLFTAPVAVRL